MNRMRNIAAVVLVFSAVGWFEPAVAQTNRYIGAEYLAPEFTAPENSPSSITVAGTSEPGARIVVTGRTLLANKPVAGVSIYVFHTDSKGFYSDRPDDRMSELHPRLHGALRTDAQGRYRYETIRPGGYDNWPAHVHYVIKADGYEPLLVALQFEDDPIIARMRKLKMRIPADTDAFRDGPCKARPDCIVTRPVALDAQGVGHVNRDIQMVKRR